MYLSAAEAISPAIRRTRTFLFQPFRLGSYLKLCLVALITEGLGGNGNFTRIGHAHRTTTQTTIYQGGLSQGGLSQGGLDPGALTAAPILHFRPEWIAAAAVFAVVGLVVGLLIFYLITRLRFAYFHCLVHNTRAIAPGWNLYGSQAGRFFWLNIVVALCFLVLMGIAAVPFIGGFTRLFHETQAGRHPDIGSILALVLPLIPLILLFVLAGIAADIILRDFMLPHYALENATAGQAWAGVWDRIAAQKASFFGYALLRIVLPIIGMIVLFAILVIPGVIYVAVVAMVEVGIHTTFAGSAGARILLMGLVGFISFLVALVVGIGFGGPLSTATREYAIIFYGGRYQPLGDILFPPPATPASPPAPTPA